MRIIYKIIYGFLLIISLTSCIDLYTELDEVSYTPKIVIEGLVVDSPGKSYVKVSLSSQNNDSVLLKHINNATVHILEDDSISYALNLTSDGYYSHPSLCGKVNSTYTLIVNHEGIDYMSISKLFPVNVIDSLKYKVIETDVGETQEYRIIVFAKRVSEIHTSYYRIKIYKNDILYNSYPDLLILTDIYLESFNNLVLPNTFTNTDTIKLEVYSISEQVFDYYKKVIELVNGSLNTVYSFPQNPMTNISNGALGVFQVSSVKSAKIVLP